MLMKWLIQTVLWLGAIAILLFVPAGTMNWTGAWIFLIETFVVSIVLGLWLARHDPELLKERLRLPIQKGQSTQDKIVTGLIVLLYLGWFAFMALDAVRFKWSAVPAWLQGPGALGVLLACYIGYLTLRENTFAAPVVKIQKERGQAVISTGPYSYVRHPMYAGMIFYLFCAPSDSYSGSCGKLERSKHRIKLYSPSRTHRIAKCCSSKVPRKSIFCLILAR